MQNPRQNVEEKIKRLKNKVASLKKDHVPPSQHAIPIRRQILPAPPWKPSLQKITWECNNNQMESKTCKRPPFRMEASKQTKLKNVLEFIRKTMETLSIYES